MFCLQQHIISLKVNLAFALNLFIVITQLNNYFTRMHFILKKCQLIARFLSGIIRINYSKTRIKYCIFLIICIASNLFSLYLYTFFIIILVCYAFLLHTNTKQQMLNSSNTYLSHFIITIL